ncbi:MAG: hypothetical protein QNJ97_04845 [Myxococcota bacterium]|nr:hypothetical protein [Myxococcota bacterium]
MGKKTCIFIIGFPEDVPRQVALSLAKRENTAVQLLVSPQHRAEADAFVSRAPENLAVVVGTPWQIDFGLSGADYLSLADRVSIILYLKAPAPPGTTGLHRGAWTATREIIELALAAPQLSHIVALSHLDVAGNAGGVFAEQDLSVGQHFTDPGQEDRFRSERVFRRFMDPFPITVVRSGWILGQGLGQCPLIELMLAAEDLSQISSKDPQSRLWAIDASSAVRLLLDIVDLVPADRGRTLHMTFKDMPPLATLVPSVKAKARDIAGTDVDLAAGARWALRKSNASTKWSVREFFKHHPFKPRFTTTYTSHILEACGRALPDWDDETAQQLISQAVARIEATKRR